MKAFLLTAALVAAGAAASPGLAQQDDAPTARVSYRDVDFADAAQVRAFYTRLRLAAQRVCNDDERTLEAFQRARACERGALDRAVAQVDRQELSALHGAGGAQVAQAGRAGR